MAEQIWNGSTSGVWSTGGNWVSASAPASTGDSATFDATSSAGTGVAGSDESATTLDNLYLKAAYTKVFGDAVTKLKVKATRVRIGEASGASSGDTGAPRINLDLSTTATTITVISTASTGTDAGKEPVRIVAVNSANKITVISGRVGIATNAATDVATFGEIGCQGTGAVVNVAAGVTLTTFRQTAGAATVYCAATTIAQDGGTLTTFGTGAYTLVQCNGTLNSNSSGTITTLEVQPSGAADFTQSITPRTVTTVKLFKGSTLSYDPNTLTVTNPIQCVNCNLEDVTINVPAGITIAVVAV